MAAPRGRLNSPLQQAYQTASPSNSAARQARTLYARPSVSSRVHTPSPRTPAIAAFRQNLMRQTDAFKIQSHLMFFDTAHNSLAKVLASLRGAFRETAAKMWAYVRCLPRPKRPDSGLIARKRHPCRPPPFPKEAC